MADDVRTPEQRTPEQRQQFTKELNQMMAAGLTARDTRQRLAVGLMLLRAGLEELAEIPPCEDTARAHVVFAGAGLVFASEVMSRRTREATAVSLLSEARGA